MKIVLAILFFSFCISIPVILPFFHKGYFPTHDGEWAVVRLADMFRILRDFQIPARYSGSLNFGYGYPLFNFAYPLPYYLGVAIHLLGIGFVDSIKILFAGSVFLSAFFMFLAASSLWKNTWAGIVSSILYIYFPYRMVNLYVRGSIGESLSFVLFPLLFFLAIRLIGKPSFLLVGGISVCVASLIMTHNIMTVLFMPAYIAFVISVIILKNKKAIKPFAVSIILGLGLSSFFWIPAIAEKSNILLSKTPIADRNLYFVDLSQFIFPRWGYGVPTDPNGFSYQLGIPHLIVLVLAVFIVFRSYLKKRHSGLSRISPNDGDSGCAALTRMTKTEGSTAFLLIALALFFTFLLFKPSSFLWDNIPLLSEINYPWVVLGVLGFLVSLLAGFSCKQFVGRYIVVFLGVLAIFLVFPYAKPESYINKGDNYYLTNEATTTSSNELMSLWVKKMPFERPAEKVEIVKGIGEVSNVAYNSKKITFELDAQNDTEIRINTIYYPGWKAKIDGKEVLISYANDKGVMDIEVPSGSHSVKAVFTETPLRLSSNAISLLSLFALLFLGIKGHKHILSNRLNFW